MKFSMVSAATAAFFTSASAVSTFAVVNHCQHDIYLWSVEGGSAPSKMFTLPANSPHIGYSETYRYVSPYAGVSVKIAPYYVGDGEIAPPFMPITQLEYTVPPPENNDPNIWYDLSFVNGNSLSGLPFSYSPSSPMAPNCMAGSCAGDYELCNAGYNFPTDDDHTHACPFQQDVIFTFCNGNAQSGLKGPTGKLNCDSSSCSAAVTKREAEPEPQPEPEADPLAVCYSAAAAQAGEGVPILAALCADTPKPAPPTPTSTSTSTSSTAAASTASAVAALQQPAKAPTTTSSSVAPAPTHTQASSPPPAAAPAAGPPTSPLSQLQLSNLASTGVSCWLSVQNSNTCGVSSRSLPEKRSVHEHSHRHNHQAFHRRNRIIKSVA